MKKRLFVVLAVLALTVCLLPMVVGAETSETVCDGIHHVWSTTAHVKVEATCTTAGTVAYYCKNGGCSAAITDTVDPYNHVGFDRVEMDDAVEATCTTPGKKASLKCSACNAKVQEGEVIPALNHVGCGTVEMDDGYPASCKNNGTDGKENSLACAKCGEKVQDGKTIPGFPHTYSNKPKNGEPTCQEPYTETKWCLKCGGAGKKVTFTTDCVAKSDNNAVEDTCTTIGKTATESCKWCGKHMKDHEVDDRYPTHNYASRHVEIPATCEEDGSAVDYCTNGKCGSGKPVVLPALNHDWADATCTAPKTCKREGCGKTEGKELGHAWDNGVVIQQPTHYAAGIKLYTCQNDPTHTYEEGIAVLLWDTDPNLDRVPRTGNAFIEWLYALIAG